MLMPSVFGENLFDDFFNFPSGSFAADSMELMKTDVKDNEDSYEITMNLPGVKRDDVKAELKQGYLTIHANSEVRNEERMRMEDISGENVIRDPAAEAFMSERRLQKRILKQNFRTEP